MSLKVLLLTQITYVREYNIYTRCIYIQFKVSFSPDYSLYSYIDILLLSVVARIVYKKYTKEVADIWTCQWRHCGWHWSNMSENIIYICICDMLLKCYRHITDMLQICYRHVTDISIAYSLHICTIKYIFTKFVSPSSNSQSTQ